MRIICAALALLVGGAAAGRSQVRNDELGYTITPPPGFQESPEGLSQQDVVACETILATTPGTQGFSPASLLLHRTAHGSIARPLSSALRRSGSWAPLRSTVFVSATANPDSLALPPNA